MGLFGSMQALTILCGIVRVKCVALLLGTTGVGLFGIFNSAQLLLATTQLNLRYSAVRDIAQASSYNRQNETCNFLKRNEQNFSFFASFFL